MRVTLSDVAELLGILLLGLAVFLLTGSLGWCLLVPGVYLLAVGVSGGSGGDDR